MYFFSIQKGVNNAHDLFVLCVILLLGGLTHVFRSDLDAAGTPVAQQGQDEEERRVDAFLDALTSEQVEFVCSRMALAGVHANVDVIPLSEVKNDLLLKTDNKDSHDGWTSLEASLHDSGIHQFRHMIMNEGDGSKLEDHVLIVGTAQSRIVINFAPVLNEVVDE